MMTGPGGAGKTSTVRSLLGEPFEPAWLSTIGADTSKTVTVDRKLEVVNWREEKEKVSQFEVHTAEYVVKEMKKENNEPRRPSMLRRLSKRLSISASLSKQPEESAASASTPSEKEESAPVKTTAKREAPLVPVGVPIKDEQDAMKVTQKSMFISRLNECDARSLKGMSSLDDGEDDLLSRLLNVEEGDWDDVLIPNELRERVKDVFMAQDSSALDEAEAGDGDEEMAAALCGRGIKRRNELKIGLREAIVNFDASQIECWIASSAYLQWLLVGSFTYEMEEINAIRSLLKRIQEFGSELENSGKAPTKKKGNDEDEEDESNDSEEEDAGSKKRVREKKADLTKKKKKKTQTKRKNEEMMVHVQYKAFLMFFREFITLLQEPSFIQSLRGMEELFAEVVQTVISVGVSWIQKDLGVDRALVRLCLWMPEHATPNDQGHDFSIRNALKLLLPVYLGEERNSRALNTALRNWSSGIIYQIFTSSKKEYALIFVQHACIHAPDRCEPRSILVQALVDLVSTCMLQSNQIMTGLISFLKKLGRSSTANHRIFAAELSSHILCISTGNQGDLNKNALIEILKCACEDKLPSVRAGAIKGLGMYLAKGCESPTSETTTTATVDGNSNAGQDDDIDKSIFEILRIAVSDEKPAVRREAMRLFVILSSCARKNNDAEFLSAILERTNDTSSAVRKLSLDALSNVFEHNSGSQVMIDAFVRSVYLVHDSEKSVSQKVIEMIDQFIMQPLSVTTKKKMEHEKTISAMPIYIIGQVHAQGGWKFFQSALVALTEADTIKTKALVQNLSHFIENSNSEESNVNTVNANCCWMLLEFLCCGPSTEIPGGRGEGGGEDDKEKKETTTQMTNTNTMLSKMQKCATQTLDPEFVISHKDLIFETGKERESCGRMIVRIIGSVASKLSEKRRDEMIEFILNRMLIPLKCDPLAGRAAIKTLLSLLKAMSCDDAGDENRMQNQQRNKKQEQDKFSMLLEGYESEINHLVIDMTCSLKKNPETIARAGLALFLIGEIVLLGVDLEPSGGPDYEQNKKLKNDDEIVQISNNLETMVCALACPKIASLPASMIKKTSSKETSDFTIPASIRAYAFITLGKMCLRDAKLTKKVVPVMVQDLAAKTSDPRIRSNILIVLGNLCRRFTNIVERHLQSISRSLTDPSPSVRKQTLLFFVNLLQEDYVKWNSGLFYRVLICCADVETEISSFAKHSLVNVFLKRTPTLFMTHFVESIFILTGFTGHLRYNRNRYLDFEDENENQKLLGLFVNDSTSGKDQRMKVYRVMLETLDDTQRIELARKICQVILGGLLDGSISQNEKMTERLVCDAIAILQCPEISVARSSSKNDVIDQDGGDTAAGDDGEPSESKKDTLEAAKGKVLSALEKKAVLESITPLLGSLYHMLLQERSGLVKYVMEYLQSLMKRYKNDLKELLDKGLVAELEHELKLTKSR